MEKIEVIRGDDLTIELALTEEDGTPVNLTGTTVFFTVKKKLADSDEDAVISKEVTDHTEPENGVAVISLDNDETDIAAGIYHWDIQILNAGKISSINYGIFRVIPDVTRRTA